MMQVPDELLMAYADGELTVDEQNELELLLRQDPALRARLEPFVETRMRLSYAFDQVLHDPVPDRLVATIAMAGARPRQSAQAAAPTLAERIRDAVNGVLTATFPNGFTPNAAAAVASLLLVGGVTGWIAARSVGPSGMVAVTEDRIIASGALAQALETLPSALPTVSNARDEARATPVLTFKSHSDGVCREYRVSTPASTPDYAGLACRGTDGTWRIALHTETRKLVAGAGAYQTATAENVAAVDALTESLITGEAFGREEEAALLANGWQPPSPGTVPGAPLR